MKDTLRILVFCVLGLGSVFAQLPYAFPQMVPEEYMQPGFHRSVDAGAFPKAMRDARTAYISMINAADVDALFEQRTFTGSRVFQGEGSFSTQTLNYEIMYPPADAVAPPGGFPLVFTTYGRGRLAEAMALNHFRQHHPAYVVAFLHTERPGPLHAPPVHLDFANLFLEVFDWLFDEYNIDQNRVYGSGWSRGGSSMTILSHAYAQRPDFDGIPLITAAVPSAGGFQDLLDNAVESIKDVKWFSLQGADDGNSNPRGSEFAFDQLEKVGALDNIFWWIEDTGHSPHSVGWNVAEIVEWMFAQTKADLLVRPDAVLNIDVTDAGVPLTFTADASASTPNNGGSISAYTWQLFKSQFAIADYSARTLHGWTLDTGFQGAEVISTDASVTYTIEEPGTWWLRVIIEDDEGNRRAATQEIHARAVIPTASFTFSRNHEAAGQAVLFNAGGSSAEFGATISSYSWNFGDGHSASGEQPAHTFASPGTYEVTLTVTSSNGNTHTRVQTVTVTQAFPGYRFFRFVGLSCHQTYRSPRIDSFLFRTGNTVFPRQPMTSNVSQGITLDGTWNADTVWRAFNHDTANGWSHHNYFTPGGWTMDVGEEQRFVPTGVNITMRSGNNRWTDFDVEASVDGERWDTIWRRRLDPDGFMNTNGEEILFAGVPFLELKNIEDGGVFGLGTAFALQADLTHMGGVTGVEYFANGLSLGTATEGPDYTLSWTPASAGAFTLTAVATFDSGTRTQATWFTVEITIDPGAGPPPVPARIAISPESFTVFTGGTLQLTAVVTDDDDQPIHSQPAFDWSVSPGGGSVDATGRFTAGTAAGTFTITASASFPDAPHSLSGTATVEVLPAPDLYLRIDFGTNHTAPGAGWNSVSPAASHNGLIHGITGEATAVVLDMINTGGSGIQSSSNTDAWGTREVAPDWANAAALNDRLWVSNGHSATLRFRNLNPEKTYTLEIASGFAGGGSNGNEPGIFEVMGAEDAVEGRNAHTRQQLGTQVHWTSRGPNDGGNAPHAQEGWMIWENVRPNAEGHIDVRLSTGTASTARVSLNAARLIENPPQNGGTAFENWLNENDWDEEAAVHHQGWLLTAAAAFGMGLRRMNGEWTGAIPLLTAAETGAPQTLTLHLTGNPGRWYQLEARDRLEADGEAAWLPVSGLRPGQGETLAFTTDPPGPGGSRFYRVRVLTEGE